MSPRWVWQGGDLFRDLLEVEIPEQSLAIALIVHEKLAAQGAARSRICIAGVREWTSLVHQSPQDLEKWLAGSGLERSQISQIRVVGSPQFSASMAGGGFSQLGITVGKFVVLNGQIPLIHFLPKEGRIRIPKSETHSQSQAVNSTAFALRKPRVLVVDDSETIQKLLHKIISDDADLEFVGAVGLPSLAEEAIKKFKPDVITMDIHMPEMNGVELLKKLLPKYRIPIVMISSLSREEGTFVLDALEAGAVDYIQKPAMSELAEVAPRICEKIKNAALATVQTVTDRTFGVSHDRVRASSQDVDFGSLIVIGSSTGGTEALKHVLAGFPDKIPPVLIVQHIPPVFSKAFADRMNQLFPFQVREAQDGDLVEPSVVLVAPGGKQMKVKDSGGVLKIVIDDSDPVNRHKPSVDVLFDSVVALKRKRVAAAILTGMGADGAKGLLRLKQSGAHTVAQDEATCVVYGMPKEAAKLGAAEVVAPLPQVASKLIQFCKRAKTAA
jgi:two-component system chemotaxis response regulator CheB